MIINAKMAIKNDDGKAPVVQGFIRYFPRAMEAVARCSEHGIRVYGGRYSDLNFTQVPYAKSRYLDALGRHLERPEGSADIESGLDHAFHMAWNAMAYVEMLLIERETPVNACHPGIDQTQKYAPHPDYIKNGPL